MNILEVHDDSNSDRTCMNLPCLGSHPIFGIALLVEYLRYSCSFMFTPTNRWSHHDLRYHGLILFLCGNVNNHNHIIRTDYFAYLGILF